MTHCMPYIFHHHHPPKEQMLTGADKPAAEGGVKQRGVCDSRKGGDWKTRVGLRVLSKKTRRG